MAGEPQNVNWPVNAAYNVPGTYHSTIWPNQSVWPPPVRVVVRESAVALTVPEIVSLVQEGIITAAQAAELLGFKP